MTTTKRRRLYTQVTTFIRHVRSQDEPPIPRVQRHGKQPCSTRESCSLLMTTLPSRGLRAPPHANWRGIVDCYWRAAPKPPRFGSHGQVACFRSARACALLCRLPTTGTRAPSSGGSSSVGHTTESVVSEDGQAPRLPAPHDRAASRRPSGPPRRRRTATPRLAGAAEERAPAQGAPGLRMPGTCMCVGHDANLRSS